MDTRLEGLRYELDLNKKEFVKKLGVSGSIYSRWELGNAIIPTRRLYQIANLYEVNIDYILKFTDERIKLKSSNEINMSLVSKRVKEVRQELNLSLLKIGELLNTSGSTWNAYELGKTLILCAFLIEVCKMTNISADYILGRSNVKYIKK